jgi:hypothetical protein
LFGYFSDTFGIRRAINGVKMNGKILGIKKKFQAILLFTFLISGIQNHSFASIIGIGSAEIFNLNKKAAQRQAKRNAIRDAVQKGVEKVLQKEIIFNNWELIKNEFYYQSALYVKNSSTILSEEKSNRWHHQISAEIALENIKAKLRELRVIHDKMGLKTIFLCNRPVFSSSFHVSRETVDSVLDSIANVYLKKGFKLIRGTSSKPDSLTIPKEDLKDNKLEFKLNKANSFKADILAEVEIIESTTLNNHHFKYQDINSEIRIKLFNVSTGKLISHTRSFQNQITAARYKSFDWEKDFTGTSIRSAITVALESVSQLFDYYRQTGVIGDAFLLTFRNFGEEQKEAFIEILSSIEGYQSHTELPATEEDINIEAFFNIKMERLERKIKNGAKKVGIKLETEDIPGYRLLFVNKELE